MLDPARESAIDSPPAILDALRRVHERGMLYAHGEDATRLLDETLAAVIQLFPAHGCWAYLLDAFTKQRHVVVYRDCTSDLAALWDSTGDEQIASHAALTGSDLVIVDDVRTAAAYPEPLRRALVSAQAVSFQW